MIFLISFDLYSSVLVILILQLKLLFHSVANATFLIFVYNFNLSLI